MKSNDCDHHEHEKLVHMSSGSSILRTCYRKGDGLGLAQSVPALVADEARSKDDSLLDRPRLISNVRLAINTTRTHPFFSKLLPCEPECQLLCMYQAGSTCRSFPLRADIWIEKAVHDSSIANWGILEIGSDRSAALFPWPYRMENVSSHRLCLRSRDRLFWFWFCSIVTRCTTRPQSLKKHMAQTFTGIAASS